MAESDIEEVSLSLQENACDFIEKGLSYIVEEEKSDYKYALLHVFSGTLLFLKDILYKEHWSLIFQDIDRAKKSDLLDNKIVSVNFSTLMSRIQNLTEFKIEEQLINDLEWMQKERNKIEHFFNSINHFEVQSRIASLLGNLISLIKSIHKSDESYDLTGLTEHEYHTLFEVLQEYSLQFEQYIIKRNRVIQGELKKCYMVTECPSCKQNSLEVDSTNFNTKCHFCLEELTFDMFFAKYTPIQFDIEAQDIMDSIGNCPNCNSEFLYETDKVTCFNCLETYKPGEITNCLRCFATIAGEGLCDSCIEFVMKQ